MKTVQSYLDFLNRTAEIRNLFENEIDWEHELRGGRYYRFFKESIPAIYVYDFTSQRFLYFNNELSTLMDCLPTELGKRHMDVLKQKCHVSDLNIYEKKIFPSVLSFLKTKQLDTYQNHVSSFNFRIKMRDSSYKYIEKKTIYIKPDSNGLPLACISLLQDRSSRKQNSTITHTVEDIYQKRRLQYIQKYTPDTEKTQLTTREIQILHQLALGKNSQQIAVDLKIDKYTVDNHRKNMLRKTNLRNTVQLVVWAYENYIFSLQANF